MTYSHSLYSYPRRHARLKVYPQITRKDPLPEILLKHWPAPQLATHGQIQATVGRLHNVGRYVLSAAIYCRPRPSEYGTAQRK
jgi:hypothetical protein